MRKKREISLQEQSSGATDERRSQRQGVRSQLKVPIDETIEQNLGNVSLQENLCILGVP